MKQIKFSETEKHTLVDKVIAYSKKTFPKNAVKLFDKKNRDTNWQNIAKAVSKVDHTRRTAQDCQIAWNNYKRQIQRIIAKIQKTFKDTGNLMPLENSLQQKQMDVVQYFKMDAALSTLVKTKQLSRHSSEQRARNQERAVAHPLPLPPSAYPSAQNPPPLPQGAAFSTPHPRQPMNMAGPSLSPMSSYVTTSRLSPRASQRLAGLAIAPPRRHSAVQTTPLIMSSPSTSITPSCVISPKSLEEKVEELQREVRDLKDIIISNFVQLKKMLKQ
ncbi:uncharacterized protein LOC108696493 [Xenopus laevis]|uniref:Uncharacterized protein LOC108696493 n=2 Tax=Xenopus laevis TaxID=8355 RepID=A0A1L8FLQ1_XENLA|nr:uncharacterized protein LOC108696493 [Xenopus laevis]OCT72523.1 hypothetical protein XELAEV_18035502mg [Xenopus laevis]